jgi:hypothetical protein
MPPSPDDGSRFADPIRRRYEDAETGLIRAFARALSAGVGKLGKLGRRLAALIPLRRETRKILAEVEKDVARDLPKLIVEAYNAGAEEAAKELDEVRRRESEGAPLPGPKSPDELQRVFRDEFHPQILRDVQDEYRRIMAEVYGPTITEGMPRREASQRALDRFAADGITGFTDRAGRRWRIESYAEMAVRTAAQRAAIAGALDRYRAAGVDLVAVPNIPYECPLCRPFEGKVLALRKGVKPARGITVYTTVEQAFARGLGHPNCRHNLVPVYDRSTVEALGKPKPDPEGYKATQRQRELERRIRAAKRQLVAAQEFGADKAELAAHRKAVAERQAAMRAFLAAHPDLMRQSAREQVRKAGQTVERAV